ncbi:MAG: DUF3333 domain-containing protein, partial [Gammaproteobacteria bacterium]
MEDPALIGTTRELWFPVDDELDMYFKGRVDVSTAEKNRRFKDNQ